MRSAARRQQIAIGGIVMIAKKHLLPPIATPGDMVCNARHNEASETSHGQKIAGTVPNVNLVHCHRNSGASVRALTRSFAIQN